MDGEVGPLEVLYDLQPFPVVVKVVDVGVEHKRATVDYIPTCIPLWPVQVTSAIALISIFTLLRRPHVALAHCSSILVYAAPVASTH